MTLAKKYLNSDKICLLHYASRKSFIMLLPQPTSQKSRRKENVQQKPPDAMCRAKPGTQNKKEECTN
jgi:hypothetical protein